MKGGRLIRVIEGGHPGGVPVIVSHGTPGSGLLFRPWVEDARSRGIRLIIYDRPGYGGSAPQPGRSIASAAEDVNAIARELELEKLAIYGISGGGPHALACAALLPDLVAAAVAIASPAPYPIEGIDWFDGMGEDNVNEFGAAMEGRERLVDFIEHAAPSFMDGDVEHLIQAMRTLTRPVDAAVLSKDVGEYLVNATRNGIKDRRDGWVDDDIALTSPWGFEPSMIQVPVMIMHGGQDRFVPFSHGTWLATSIGHADARLLTDEGHLSLAVNRIPEVHAWLLSKIQRA